MQISKSYSGSIEALGSTSARQLSHGVTYDIGHYASKTDFINQTISGFLKAECGVDAAYEMRGDDTAPFLYIWGVPFLFLPDTSTRNYTYCYGPFFTNALMGGSGSVVYLFSSNTALDYDFSLYFTGNPKTGFALRFRSRGASIPAYTFVLRVCKATNLMTGGNSIVYTFGNSLTGGFVGDANGIDLLNDGSMKEDSFSTAAITYAPQLAAKAVNKTSAPGKFPLVPVTVGIWKLNGIYHHIRGFGIPAAQLSSVEAQTEIEISGRRFINTVAEIPATGYINLGLIETTGSEQ